MRATLAGLVALALAAAPCAGAAAEAAGSAHPAVLADQPPKLLSGFGFFAGPGIARPAEDVIPYDLVTPLFSDHALKFRHVFVPAGEAAAFVASEAFEFPVGSALIKTFAFPADFRRPAEAVRLVETRVLLRQAGGWQAWAYVWNEEQTDAELKIAGKRLDISFADERGEPVAFSYAVPNKNQCKNCHSLGGDVAPIGPKARNLNRERDYGAGPENQLAHWAALGILKGLPDPAMVEKAADWLDRSAPVDERARSWLDVNCAHCHRAEGAASNSGLFLTAGETNRVALGIGKRPVAAGRGAGDNEFDIVPGHPDRSILLSRIESTEPGIMMPELGRSLEDERAVELLREWILTLR